MSLSLASNKKEALQQLITAVLVQHREICFSPEVFPHLKKLEEELGLESMKNQAEKQLAEAATQRATATASGAKSDTNDTLLELAYGYEAFFEKVDLKQSGTFLTPDAIVNCMVRRLFQGHESAKELSLLDPACGSSLYFLRVLRSVAAEGHSLKKLLLVGVDRSLLAVLISRFILATEATRLGLSNRVVLHITLGNFLLNPADLSSMNFEEPEVRAELGISTWLSELPESLATRQFDLIIGNPPYGLSRDAQISARENELLKNVYSSSISGKPNKYLLFLARSLQLLRPGGNACFIVPNAWLGIEGGKALREKIIQQQNLRELIVFQCKVFANASVEPVVCVFKTPQLECKTEALKITHTQALDWLSDPKRSTHTVDYCVLATDPEFRIPLVGNSHTAELLVKLLTKCVPLSSPSFALRPLIALQVYATGRGVPPQNAETVATHPFHSRNPPEGPEWIKYLEGSDIHRGSVSWSGLFLKYGPWMSEHQPRERFTKARVVIREILGKGTARIVSAPYAESAAYNRSVLHIVVDNNCYATAQALSSVLNSMVGSFLLLLRGRKSQRRLFPKLVLADLHEFPLPKHFLDFVVEINAAASEERRQELIGFLYGLSQSDLQSIKEFLSEGVAATRTVTTLAPLVNSHSEGLKHDNQSTRSDKQPSAEPA